MKSFENRANQKQDVMHIHDSHMTCEECENAGHSGNNYPEIQEDVNFINDNNYHPQYNQGWNKQHWPNYQGNYHGNYQGTIISITNHL
jgi:hypothetical protein